MDFIEEQKDIFEHFGINKQKDKFIEELEELRIAFMLDKQDRIIDELADVHNVLMQLISFYGVEKVYERAIYKIERTKQRIANNYYKGKK